MGQVLSWTHVEAFQYLWEDQKAQTSPFQLKSSPEPEAVEDTGATHGRKWKHVWSWKRVCPALGQPLGADILLHLQRAAFRNGLQGIHLGKQKSVGLHLLTYHPHALAEPPQPAGRTLAILSEVEKMPWFFVESMLRPCLMKSLWPWTSLLRKVTQIWGSLCEVEKWGQPLALICALRKDYGSQAYSQL